MDSSFVVYVWPGQASLQGVPELLREVTVLGNYHHEHLVPLLSFSLSRPEGRQEACLVYPLMAGGGLDQALAARAAHPLDAATRLRIAADAAAGLAYLHAPGGGLGPLLHRDVKSSNVLLDAGLRARVADVGLARPQHGATMTMGVGTFGYMDPVYFATGERPAPPQGRRFGLPSGRVADPVGRHCLPEARRNCGGLSGRSGAAAPSLTLARARLRQASTRRRRTSSPSVSSCLSSSPVFTRASLHGLYTVVLELLTSAPPAARLLP